MVGNSTPLGEYSTFPLGPQYQFKVRTQCLWGRLKHRVFQRAFYRQKDRFNSFDIHPKLREQHGQQLGTSVSFISVVVDAADVGCVLIRITERVVGLD